MWQKQQFLKKHQIASDFVEILINFTKSSRRGQDGARELRYVLRERGREPGVLTRDNGRRAPQQRCDAHGVLLRMRGQLLHSTRDMAVKVTQGTFPPHRPSGWEENKPFVMIIKHFQ